MEYNMRTGDIYFNEWDKLCIVINGKETIFKSIGKFDIENKHATLEQTSDNEPILCYNSEEHRDFHSFTGLNITDILSDPDVIKIVKRYMEENK